MDMGTPARGPGGHRQEDLQWTGQGLESGSLEGDWVWSGVEREISWVRWVSPENFGIPSFTGGGVQTKLWALPQDAGALVCDPPASRTPRCKDLLFRVSGAGSEMAGGVPEAAQVERKPGRGVGGFVYHQETCSLPCNGAERVFPKLQTIHGRGEL